MDPAVSRGTLVRLAKSHEEGRQAKDVKAAKPNSKGCWLLLDYACPKTLQGSIEESLKPDRSQTQF